MSMIKQYLEQISVERGYDGAITQELLDELNAEQELLVRKPEFDGVNECKGCDSTFQTDNASDEYCGRCANLLSDGESVQ